MRKINIITSIDPKSYAPYMLLRIKDGDDRLEFKEEVQLPASKYTSAEIRRIDACNMLLLKNGQSAMKDDETEFFIHPIVAKQPSPEDLQKLSGFSVEKKITYK